MRVVLADPPQMFLVGNGHTRQVQPLGIAYLGAMLKRAGHEVRFLLPDVRSYHGDDPWGEIAKALADERPDLVAITAVTATFPSAAKLAEVAKSVLPGVITVLGGTHASADARGALAKGPAIDYIVHGEGEHALLAIVEGVAAGRFEPRGVPGLAFRGLGGTPVVNAAPDVIEDLDALPFPLRDPQHVIWNQDLHPAFFQGVVTLRGCPYRCIYCAVPQSSDRKTRYRSATNVLDEIETLVADHAVPGLFFHDSVFSLHRKRTLELCQGMTARGLALPFTCQTRVDRVDGELLDVMKAAGCDQIFFGIESGDVDSLKKIRKAVALDTVRSAVELVKARGIRCSGFFIVGFPWEDAEIIERTAEFAVSLGLDAISLFSATPLPGTELWDLAGGSHMPESIDFRTPQVNLTSLDDAAYSELYGNVKARIDAYNQDVMMSRVPVSWREKTITAP